VVGRKRNVRTPPSGDRSKRDITVCSKCCPNDNCNQQLCMDNEVEPTQGLPASQDTYVRLIGGQNAYEGTVEVYFNGQWGSICDDTWTGHDAAVICRMLGYSTAGAGAMSGGGYTPSQGRIWLDGLNCTGHETNLMDCPKGAWGIHDCRHQEDAAVLCPSVSAEDNIIFLMDTGLGGMIFRMNLETQSFVPIPMNKIYTASSFDYDPEYGRLYFVDPRLRQIVTVRFDGTDAFEVKQLDMSAVLEKVEVDPLNRKLFYSDTGNNVIAVMNLDGSGYQQIVTTNLDEPRDIVLDPRNQKVYWTDWGANPKIERANYDGSERTTLANTDLMWPNGMAIDYNDNKIYFVDGGTHKIEVMDLLGGNRKEIFQDAAAHFFAVDVFDKYLYYTDWNHNTLMRINKDGTGQTAVGPPSFSELSDIRIHRYGTDLPGVTTVAPVHFDRDHVFVRLNGNHMATGGFVEVYANGQWGTICDDGWDDRDAAVICRMIGFSENGAQATNHSHDGQGRRLILLDNVNCQGTEEHIVDCGITPDNWAHHNCSHAQDAGALCTVDNTMNDFIIFADAYTGLLIRMNLRTYSFTGIQLPGSPNPVALAFNPGDRKIYYSEVIVNPGSQIYSAGLDGSNPTLLKQMPQGSIVDGLAVDSTQNKLFYTDAGRDVIVSMNLDGTGEHVVVTGNLDQPRDIVLDTQNSVMYWTDWGQMPKIEKANYDGTNRQTIVGTGIKLPNGLELDKPNNLLYFCDAGTHMIEGINTDGTNRTALYTDFGAHFFGLALTDQYIYYSDWNRGGLMRLNRDGTGVTTAGPNTFSRINNVIISQTLTN